MSTDDTPVKAGNCPAKADNWLTTCLGQYLQASEQQLFDEAVGDVFGFHAVQIGMLHMDLLRNSRIPHTIHTDEASGDVHCDSMQLPFQANTIDLLLLPHALDFSQNPQQTLREAERVLMPEGHIMLTGFNPFSAWGLKHMLRKQPDADAMDTRRLPGHFPWNSNFLSLLRIRDWLALLGFELVAGSMTCYTPPFSSYKALQRFQWMDKAGARLWPMMGGVYFVVAKKKVVGMRLIRPNWNKAKLKPGLVATPSQRQKNHHQFQYQKDKNTHEQ